MTDIRQVLSEAEAAADLAIGHIRHGLSLLPPEPDPPDPPDPVDPPTGRVLDFTGWDSIPMQEDWASGGLLKPVSESDGKIVWLISGDVPAAAVSDFYMVDGQRNPHSLRYAGSEHNGGRHHLRGSNPGNAYAAPLNLVVRHEDGRALVWTAQDPSQRTEGVQLNPTTHTWPGTPGPTPTPPPTTGIFARGPGIWFEGGYADLPHNFTSPVNWFSKAGTPASTKSSDRHWRVPPWSREPAWSPGAIQNWINQTKAAGFDGVSIDVEGVFWYTSGYLADWVVRLHAAGLPVSVAPKATLGELSGNPHADVGRTDPDAHVRFYADLGVQGIAAWAYGNHGTHVACWRRLKNDWAWPTGNIMLLHDYFRYWDGYSGLAEWPRLVNWARSVSANPNDWPMLCAFQPQGDPDRNHSARMLAELDAMYA